MSFAFLPLYTGDYLRDTRHLTPLKHGIYLLLLMHCWDQKGPVPLDEQESAGIANCRSADEIESLRYILSRYFIKMDDGYYSRRMQFEIERSANISIARSEAGKKGYQAKAKQLLNTCLASASTPTPTTIPTPTLEDKKQEAKASLSGKPDDARQVIDHLNAVSGRKFREVDATLKLIRARLKEYDLDTLKAVVDQQWEVWHGTEWEKYMAPDTLFNATKCAKYVGQLGTSTKDDWRKEVMWSQE